MAETLSMRTIHRITLGSSNVVTRADLPTQATRLTVQFIAAAGKFALDGTDGQAMGSAYWTCQSNTTYEWELAAPVVGPTVADGFAVYLA